MLTDKYDALERRQMIDRMRLIAGRYPNESRTLHTDYIAVLLDEVDRLCEAIRKHREATTDREYGWPNPDVVNRELWRTIEERSDP